jgi:hypothetical protein
MQALYTVGYLAKKTALSEGARDTIGLEDAMERFSLLIDGEMVAGDQTMKVINPATEEAFADCPRASVDQLNQAVAAAKAAFPAQFSPMSKTTCVSRRRRSLVL